MDDVKRNIETEVKKGQLQRREVLRARKKSQEAEMKGMDQRELVMEAEVFSFSNVHEFKLNTYSAFQPVNQITITSAA